MFGFRVAVFSILFSISSLTAERADTDETEARFAAGDPERGRIVFRKCMACHTAEKGGKRRTGPNLWEIVGAPIADEEGFSYSEALEVIGGIWTLERLDAYLEKPSSLAKGTSMNFAGLKKQSDRANVIAFLSQMTDRRADVDTEPIGKNEFAQENSQGFGVLVEAPGVQATFDACTVCHSERIVAQQGLSREQWGEQFEIMIDEHEMAPLQEKERAAVLDYLAKHYGSDRPNFPLN
ncbi:MAG: cytochrome c family protein [Albidovulum sp.]|nr:cytochrome c family protein [Albidovulum sp.]